MRALKETARSKGDSLAAIPDEQAVEKHGYSKFAPDRIANAKMVAAAAKQWAEENADAYAFMKRRAEADVMADRRVSVAALIHDARRIDFTDSAGRSTKVDNSLTSALARMLVRDVPGLAAHVELRRCPVGDAMSEGVEGGDCG